MTLPRFSRTRAFALADGGVAAVEMALVFPVAVAMFSLVVASGTSLRAWQRTNSVTHTITDLVSRTPNTTPDPVIAGAEDLAQSDLVTDLSLSQLVMYPGDPTLLKIVMTEIAINPATNIGTVVWSQGYNGGLPTPCTTIYSLNSSYSGTGATYMLIGAASYTFQPLGVALNVTPINLSGSENITIRYAQQIIVTNVTNTTTFKQCV